MFDAEDARKRSQAYATLCDAVAVATAEANAADGRVVDLVIEAIEGGHAEGVGLHSPAHWVSWRTGCTPARARDLVAVARRASDLPLAVGALRRGELSLGQVAVIAHHVPAEYDRSVTEFARAATVSQLRRALPRYGFEPTEKPPPDPVPEREVASGVDEHGWWARIRLPRDEGEVVETALRSMQEDLWRQRRAHAPEAEKITAVTRGEALAALGETALAAGEALRPGSDRYQIHAHLEVGPDGSLQLTTHRGTLLPAGIRRRILCDCRLRGLLHRGSTPLDVGRQQHAVSRRMRRAIEHRQAGRCGVPGCEARHGLEIHHIRHWEDGGLTETVNLVALCRFHHRAHHEGLLGISGNPNLLPGTPGALEMTDRWGNVLEPVGRPAALRSEPPAPPPPYRCPAGERLRPDALFFAPG